ncbi:MAG: DUF3810 domain-containing protein [Clostridiales bacterium]|nr:DUF3810 domain-containing protein [Clostridiales bacterium]
MRRRNRIAPLRSHYTGKPHTRIPRKVLVPLLAVLFWAVCRLLPRCLSEQAVTRWLIPVSRAISLPVKLVSGLLPFALLELLMILLPVLVVVLLFIDFDGASAGADARREELPPLSAGITTLALMLALFHLTMGFGYAGLTLDRQLDFPEVPVTAEVLYDTARLMGDRAAALRPRADYADRTVRGYEAAFRQTYRELARSYPVFAGRPARPKAALLSVPMSYLGIGGLYSPFTCEALINTDTTPPSLAFTVAHEMSHSLQIARENEANFSAFLACVESEDPAIQYSGYFMGLLYALPACRRADPDGYAGLLQSIDAQVRADLQAYHEHVAEYEGVVSRTHSRINDLFLKSNGQQEGVRSYGLMVNLLVAWREAATPTP